MLTFKAKQNKMPITNKKTTRKIAERFLNSLQFIFSVWFDFSLEPKFSPSHKMLMKLGDCVSFFFVVKCEKRSRLINCLFINHVLNFVCMNMAGVKNRRNFPLIKVKISKELENKVPNV